MTKTYDVPPPPPHNEGKTPAAWTMNMGIVIGVTIIALGMVIGQVGVLIAGIVVTLLAIAAGVIMSAVGLGKKRAPRSATTA